MVAGNDIVKIAFGRIAAPFPVCGDKIICPLRIDPNEAPDLRAQPLRRHDERRRVRDDVVERSFGFTRSDQERNISGKVRRVDIKRAIYDFPAIDHRAKTVIAMTGRNRNTIGGQQPVSRHGLQGVAIVHSQFIHQPPHRFASSNPFAVPRPRSRQV